MVARLQEYSPAATAAAHHLDALLPYVIPVDQAGGLGAAQDQGGTGGGRGQCQAMRLSPEALDIE